MRRGVLWTAMLALLAIVPAAGPATAPNSLKLMSDAYRKLTSLSLGGTIEFSADIDGQVSHQRAEFSDLFVAPMRFRHEVTGDVIAAGTGDKVFVFLPRQNTYSSADAPSDRGSFSQLPDDLRALLRVQDLSMVFALSENPAEQLLAGATDISASGDWVTVTLPGRVVTVTLDASTHLVKQVVIDPSDSLRKRGADVKSAKITIDYLRVVPDAAIADSQLAFAPPATAQEDETAATDAADLIGKPAPDFTLAKLEGGSVTNRSLRGGIYVLEFWSTSSGQSLLSLAAMDAMSKQYGPQGVKIFAVNLKEAADPITAMMTRLGLDVPVLLDADGKVGTAFAVSALPCAVVVGKDGAVLNIFSGAGQEQDIAGEIENAIAKGKKAVQ